MCRPLQSPPPRQPVHRIPGPSPPCRQDRAAWFLPGFSLCAALRAPSRSDPVSAARRNDRWESLVSLMLCLLPAYHSIVLSLCNSTLKSITASVFDSLSPILFTCLVR